MSILYNTSVRRAANVHRFISAPWRPSVNSLAKLLIRSKYTGLNLGQSRTSTATSTSIQQIRHSPVRLYTAEAIPNTADNLVKTRFKDLSHPITRIEGFEDLLFFVGKNEIVKACYTVRRMQKSGALVDLNGLPTLDVLSDAKVTEILVSLMKKSQVWDDTFQCLSLILSSRYPKILGRIETDIQPNDGFVKDPVSSLGAIKPVIEAILSPHLTDVRSRKLAGLSALQILTDWKAMDIPEFRALKIRALGFSSRKHRLHLFVDNIDKSTLLDNEKFELVAAYARCFELDTAIDGMQKYQLSRFCTNAQTVEIWVAICMGYAETTKFEDALLNWGRVCEKDSLWTKDQMTFDKEYTDIRLKLDICVAALRSVVPRLPFTQGLHTDASTKYSRVYSQSHFINIVDVYTTAIKNIDPKEKMAGKKYASLNKLLFECECLISIISGLSASKKPIITHAQLWKKLRWMIDKYSTRDLDRQPFDTSLVGMFLWTIAMDPKQGQLRAMGYVEKVIEYTLAKIPSAKLTAADLEPAFRAALPAAMWKTKRQGNFYRGKLFLPADELIGNVSSASFPPYVSKLIELSRKVLMSHHADLRLIPIEMWIYRFKLDKNRVLSTLNLALNTNGIKRMHKSLVLAPIRDSSFYEQVFTVLASFSAGARKAITVVHAAMQHEAAKVPLTSSLGEAIIRCCVPAQNMPVALDVIKQLKIQQALDIPSRINELFMRVLFATGKTEEAMQYYRKLSFEGNNTLINEPSFMMIINNMGMVRKNIVGAEHAFHAWLTIMDYQGRISPSLLKQYRNIGMSPEAVREENAFLLWSNNAKLRETMESCKIESCESGSQSNKNFMREWEVCMLMSLVSSYINNGYLNRAKAWKTWLLDAVDKKLIELSTSTISPIGKVQMLHIGRGSLDEYKECLDYAVSITNNLKLGLTKDKHYLSQSFVFRALARKIREDKSGMLEGEIKTYLEGKNADKLYISIKKLI